MRTHISTKAHSVALYQCYEMLPFYFATLRIPGELTKVVRCGKKLDSFPGLPTVQFCDHLQAIENWTVGRPGNDASMKSLVFIHKRLLKTPGHCQEY